MRPAISIDDAVSRMMGDVDPESETTTQDDHTPEIVDDDVVDAPAEETEGEEQPPEMELAEEGDDVEEVETDEAGADDQDEDGEVEDEVEETNEDDVTEDDDEEVQEKSFQYDPDIELDVPGVGKTTLDELRRNHLREGDYTRKTQELAAKEKASESRFAEREQALEKERQTLSEKAEVLDATLDVMRAQFKAEEPSLDDLEKLAVEDPQEFQLQQIKSLRRKNQQEEAEKQVAAARSERDRLDEENKSKRKAEFDTWVDSQRSALYTAKPEWSDETKFNTALLDMAKAVEPYGITQKEVFDTLDHRQLLFLDAFNQQAREIERLKGETKKERAKAAKVDKAKPALKKKVLSSKKRIKPVSSEPAKPENKASALRKALMKQKGYLSVDDAAKVLNAG